MANYLRNQIAKMAGVSIETLRYYEKKGLIQPERSENGYRLYPEATIDRLNFIKRAKEAGFTLEEIKKTFKLFDYQLDSEELSNIMAEGIIAKIKEIDGRIAGMMEIHGILFQIYEGLQQQHTCPTLEPLMKK
ncbi:MAG: MerR family transcriptional regulator [Firmicutes bacterium]|mgnify:CR=1 FL=1|nr:MerR family transcriptional regulator [Bacillota bacterium]